MRNLNHHKVFGQALALGIAFFVALIVFIVLVVSSNAQNRIPPAPDAQDQTLQFFFDGKWYPSLDAAKIGPNNYTELKNLRYSDEGKGLEGVSGYSKINTTAVSTYTSIRVGHQLQTDRTTPSYVLIQGENSGETASRVLVNTTAIPSQGNFSSTIELDTSGYSYRDDSTGAGLGRFSDAPLGHVAYANGVENLIWAGEEMRVGAFFTTDTSNELLNETDFSSSSNWATSEQVDIVGGVATFTFDGTLNGTLQQTNANLAASPEASVNYYFGYTVSVATAPNADFGLLINGGAGDVPTANTTIPFTAGRHVISFRSDSAATTANFTIEATGSSVTQGSFTIDDVTLIKSVINPANETEAINNTLSTTGNTVTLAPATRGTWLVMTTRPIQAVYYDVSSANASASTLLCQYWKNDGTWTDVSNASDGTSAGGKALAQDGWYTFDYASDVAPYYLDGIYMYAYRFILDAGSAVVKYSTVNAPMQDIVDLWDGVPRQPISFQHYDNADAKFYNYTYEVNYESVLTGDSTATVPAVLDGMTSSDYIIIMSDDRLAGVTFNFVAGEVNTTASRYLNVLYWDGDSYENVSGNEIDGTQLGTATFGQSGTIWWVAPSESSEKVKSEFGKTGYSYKITVTDTLSASIDLDVVTLIPAQKTLPNFAFPATYNNRLFLCDNADGKQRNRCDFTQTNSTEVWNGAESSDGGVSSMYFGGSEPVTAAMEIYNRYGSRVETKFVVFKDSEIHTVEGDTVEDMLNGKQRVTTEVGCPAPLTLMSVPVGYAIAQDVLKNMLFWIDTSGPMSFDGELVIPIGGVEKYFDPTEDDCVNFDEIERSVGWYDAQNKEINFLLPSGSGQTTNNLWIVYEPRSKRWFRKDTGNASFPQTGFVVQDAYGTKYTYGGIDTGFMMRIESGNSWADTSDAKVIEQVVETGDFWPTGNVWDLTRIRKIKLWAKRLNEQHQVVVQHYSDTDESQGLYGLWLDEGGEFQDWEGGEWVGAALESTNLFLTGSLNRVVRDTLQDNLFGWSHRFKFSLSTFETAKGFQPMGWGVVFRKENRFDE